MGAGRGRDHAPHRARAARAMTWGCGGWRSGTPPITFTSWRRWPARTAPGPGSGTTSTGSGRPARTPSAGSGCAVLLRGIAPPPGAPPAPRRSRRPAADGASRPGRPCAARCAPRPPGRPRSRSSSPASARPGCWCACGTASPARVEVTGYAVGLAQHTARDGGVIWYGGGKLAPDLTLPKLRARWASPAGHGPADGAGAAGSRRRALCCGTWSPGRRSSAPG